MNKASVRSKVRSRTLSMQRAPGPEEAKRHGSHVHRVRSPPAECEDVTPLSPLFGIADRRSAREDEGAVDDWPTVDERAEPSEPVEGERRKDTP